MPAEYPIPETAIGSALSAYIRADYGDHRPNVIAVLSAAAPHIAAAALRQAAEDYSAEITADAMLALAALGDKATVGAKWDACDRQSRAIATAAWLRHRADAIDGRTYPQDTRAELQARLDQKPVTE